MKNRDVKYKTKDWVRWPDLERIGINSSSLLEHPLFPPFFPKPLLLSAILQSSVPEYYCIREIVDRFM